MLRQQRQRNRQDRPPERHQACAIEMGAITLGTVPCGPSYVLGSWRQTRREAYDQPRRGEVVQDSSDAVDEALRRVARGPAVEEGAKEAERRLGEAELPQADHCER